MVTLRNTLAVAAAAILLCQVAEGGLIERYDFDGATGLEDSSGSTNDATNDGVEFVTDTLRGSTVAVFGTGDHLQVPLGSGSTNAWSVATWMRIKANSYLIDTRVTPGGDNLILSAGLNSGDRLGFWDGSAWRTNSTGAPLADNRWHHAAWVYDGTANTMTYYLDGQQTNTVAAPVDRNVENSFWIGEGNSNFVGKIDEFHFYDSTLTGSQVAALAVRSPIPHTPTEFRIDIDSTTTGPLDTTPGWTSLDATEPSAGDEVAIGDAIFEVFNAAGSRSRSGPNSLTRDLIYRDGTGATVGLEIWHLPAGVYEAKVWAWDSGVAPPIGALIVGWMEGSTETIVTTNAIPDPDDPIVTFRFTSDGTSMYRIFTRENNDTNQARFNALQLTRIPEPSTFLLAAFGLLGLVVAGRRRSERA